MEPSYPHILIVEGGGMRGVFSTGVLDRFLEIGFDPFDLFLGVSSGAGNIAAFMARMVKRNLKIYTSYSLSPEFISIKKFLRGSHLMDLDWMWEKTISDIRLDLETIYRSGRPFIVCLTDVQSGRALYKETCAKNLEEVLKASAAMPLLYRTFPGIDGRSCTDGGIADPIPVKEAIGRGGLKIMVLRSRPRFYRKKEKLIQWLMRVGLKEYPALLNAVLSRVTRYNESIELIRQPGTQVSIIEVCPSDDLNINRFTRNRSKLIAAYSQGKKEADKAVEAWHQGA